MKLKGLISAAAAAALTVGALPAPTVTKAAKAAVIGDTIYNGYNMEAPAVTTTAKSAVTTTTAKTAVTTTAAKTTVTTTVKTTTAAPTTTTTTYKPAVQGQPVFHLNSTEVCQTEARTKKQKVYVTVDGANGLYCDTLIYVYYDSRMTADTAIAGKAVEKLATGQAFGDTKDFLVLTTSGDSDLGADGIMWELTFALPADCKAGDVFSVSIGDSKYGKIKPLFTNFAYDSKGDDMTKHIFTNGLAKANITVTADPPYKLGDINNDFSINAVDASTALTEYASVSSGKKTTFTDERQTLAADVDKNSAINAVDASYILSYYAYTSTSAGTAEDFEAYMAKETAKAKK
ncbi:dockerin type I domain-containing protein [Ruminococcus sp.]|uniref:dockerin type I domain-containing protein n=1 Tax=Ruminococcus sp. TaxID=41978 RepID=UPI0025D36A7D|nr:dockerin type I domain-containing protein [Ruminococcus sp.]MCR4639305.1 hypothetical protein [Ruminococcus sp.]